jgi:AcrR family transcriptional regulator
MASSSSKARGVSPLRTRLTEATRDAILDAFVAQLGENGGVDVPYASLARRAGVSIQTLYRHFPRREQLLDALTRRVGTALGLRDYPRTRDGVSSTIRALFPRFDQHAALLVAQIHAGPAGQARSRGRARRAGAFQAVLAEATPHLPAERRNAAAGILNVLVSANTWYRLRTEVGLDGVQAGEITAWAVDTLWRALEAENEKARRR